MAERRANNISLAEITSSPNGRIQELNNRCPLVKERFAKNNLLSSIASEKTPDKQTKIIE